METDPSAASGTLETMELPVSGMRCESCIRRLQGALESLPGVERVEARMGRVRLDFYPEAVSIGLVRARIEVLGYGIPGPSRSPNPIRRLLERMARANARALAGKRLDCCRILEDEKR